jgi:hypothetical protein
VGGGNPVFNYVISVERAIVMPITPRALTLPELTLAWTIPGPAVVSAYVTTEYGVTFVMAGVQVTSPQVSAFTSMTRQVSLQRRNGLLYLSFGTDGGWQNAGIVTSALLTGTQSVSGQFGVFQLCTHQRFATDTDDVSYHWSQNGMSVLDVGMTNSVLYQGIEETITPGNYQTTYNTDAPGSELKEIFQSVTVGSAAALETYNAYLMFKPTGLANIWVPLAVLTWAWGGEAVSVNDNWGGPINPQNTINPVGVPTNVFPIWDDNTSRGQWVENN